MFNEKRMRQTIWYILNEKAILFKTKANAKDVHTIWMELMEQTMKSCHSLINRILIQKSKVFISFHRQRQCRLITFVCASIDMELEHGKFYDRYVSNQKVFR